MGWRRRWWWTGAALLGVVLTGAPAEARPAAGRVQPSGLAPAPSAAAPSVAAPSAAAPVGGRVLRPFDPPATPYGRGHRGVDLAALPGEPVRAARAGTVTFAGRVAGVSWVTVAHADGLATTYGGFVPSVQAGDHVGLGARLGMAGDRARLDWGARRDGRYIDPLLLLGGWRVVLVPVR
jgi:murein DD-endopeptidase MepM/ murein hydrolase activator NlpD